MFAFSSLYAQFKLKCSVEILSSNFIFMDLPIEFDNLNNIAINAILLFGANTISSNTAVLNRRIELQVSVTIPANTEF